MSAYKDLCVGLAHLTENDPARSAELVKLMTRMRAEIRAHALEEAALICDRARKEHGEFYGSIPMACAIYIRALKDKP